MDVIYTLSESKHLKSWNGDEINKSILTRLVVGNLIRINIRWLPLSDGGIHQFYVRIIRFENDKIVGVFDDPYYLRGNFKYGSDFPIKDGAEIIFTKNHVSEIPLQFSENENLRARAL
jgi:hypothetical protein